MHQLVADYVKANGMTFDAIAKKLGITRVSLWQKLNGKREFKLSEAYALADILGVSVDEFRKYI